MTWRIQASLWTRGLILASVAGVSPLGRLDGCAADGPKVIMRPGPVAFPPHVIPRKASVPDDVDFGVVCDVGGELMTGDWKVIAKVTRAEHSPGKVGLIEFETLPMLVEGEVRYKSRVGRLAYKLPHDLTLPLNPGDPVTIMHDHETDKKRLEWDIHISSGDKLILASTHRHDDAPPESAQSTKVLFDGAPGGHSIFYWADPENDELDQKKSDRVASKITVKTRSGDGLQAIEIREKSFATVKLDGQEYKLAVLASELYGNEDVSSHDHADDVGHQADVDDESSQSHTLECILIRVQ